MRSRTTAGLACMMVLALGMLHAREAGAAQTECKPSGLCMVIKKQDSESVWVEFMGGGNRVTHFNYKRPGGSQDEQKRFQGVQLMRYGSGDSVDVQWCIKPTIGRSECGRWERFQLPAPAQAEPPPAQKKIRVLGKRKVDPNAGEDDPRRCAQGFVWRVARPADLVCVTPEARSRTAEENRRAASRRDPGGAYGPESCVVGYVWREAFEGDTVCVTPETRTLVREENRLAASRRTGG